MILASVLDIHFQIDKELSGKETSKISLILLKKKKSNLNIDPNELKIKDKISEILNFIAFTVLKCFQKIEFFINLFQFFFLIYLIF